MLIGLNSGHDTSHSPSQAPLPEEEDADYNTFPALSSFLPTWPAPPGVVQEF